MKANVMIPSHLVSNPFYFFIFFLSSLFLFRWEYSNLLFIILIYYLFFCCYFYLMFLGNTFPLPEGGAVEGRSSPGYGGCTPGADCHILVVHHDEAALYEAYQASFDGSSYFLFSSLLYFFSFFS